MTYEVENKFSVGDVAALELRLEARGAPLEDPQLQIDTYYRHPGRDFAKTDEALRIRRMEAENFVTYKGPKVDKTTKTRKEIEVPIGDGDSGADKFATLLESLGFTVVAEVRKRRRKSKIVVDGNDVEIAVDEVDNVGGFIELELRATDETLDAARKCLISVAGELGLGTPERRSYLEMLLEKVSS